MIVRGRIFRFHEGVVDRRLKRAAATVATNESAISSNLPVPDYRASPNISVSSEAASRCNSITSALRGSITNESKLSVYVISITGICIAIALSVDVTNQLIFFVDWATCLRSWSITAILVLALALPISRTIGKSHLALYRAKVLAEHLGRTDQLTGLPNRRALMEAVHAAQSHVLALAIVDIDRFKRVNDTHGHLAGDAVIKAVGKIMAEELGQTGQVARVGGEEFALLSIGISSESLASKLAAFRDRVSSTPIVINGLGVRVTVSAGVALQRDGETFDQLYSAADQALYAAKSSGRDRIQFAAAFESLREQGGVEQFELKLGPMSRSHDRHYEDRQGRSGVVPIRLAL
jgi:diguanylate cyclase (GGDEF)-like protein